MTGTRLPFRRVVDPHGNTMSLSTQVLFAMSGRCEAWQPCDPATNRASCLSQAAGGRYPPTISAG
ncbi:hypothetical protein [Longispora albida]|uniref:hypothetical protein n=1 Tax=Longispora albida TaxID=203523 RepID=UPI0012FBDCA1|nr:hypothetical protein [Longispora albida]